MGYLGISALPLDGRLESAMQALEDLAAWMQENAYTALAEDGRRRA
jgi:hypothetical protein